MATSPVSIWLSNLSNVSCTMSSVSQPAATPWLNWASSWNRSTLAHRSSSSNVSKKQAPRASKISRPLYYGFMNEFHDLLFT